MDNDQTCQDFHMHEYVPSKSNKLLDGIILLPLFWIVFANPREHLEILTEYFNLLALVTFPFNLSADSSSGNSLQNQNSLCNSPFSGRTLERFAYAAVAVFNVCVSDFQHCVRWKVLSPRGDTDFSGR